jgi:translation initiation factor IF-2
MLPEEYCQRYQEFQQKLQQLSLQVGETPADQRELGSAPQAVFQEIQQLFQQIIALDLEGLDPADVSKVQSYQTEINKQLRLLGMDVMFLRAARQSATAQQRQTQMGDRINLLVRYCDALLKTDQPESNPPE